MNLKYCLWQYWSNKYILKQCNYVNIYESKTILIFQNPLNWTFILTDKSSMVTRTEKQISGKISTSLPSQKFIMNKLNKRMCSMHCLYDPVCTSFNTFMEEGEAVCQTNKCRNDVESTMIIKPGGEYFHFYRNWIELYMIYDFDCIEISKWLLANAYQLTFLTN